MLLITGGFGFIGLNFVELCLKKKTKILVIDKLTYAANKAPDFVKDKNFNFIKCNIGDKKKVHGILRKYKISSIINFAAETHVDNSIKDPDNFVESNILDFYNLLKETKNYYYEISREKKKKFKFVQVSTDEVYGSLKKNEPKFTEKSKFFPNNPYSSTKSASDLISRAWYKTYDFPIIVTNCCNNYGKFQHREKLIPKIIYNALNNKTIPIYGNGKNLREWIHVEDHCLALSKILKKGKSGETYNIGTAEEITNIVLVKKICKILDSIVPINKKNSYVNLISFVKDRKAHDFRYAINSSKINKKLKWTPKISFEKGLKKTIQYYLNQLI